MSIRAIEKLKGIESPEIQKPKLREQDSRPKSRDGKPRGSQEARGPRPEGERRPRPEGERRPRPEGERRPRPEGERRPRPEGERRPRPEGERKPRHERGPRRDQAAQAPREQQPQQLAQTPGSEASKVGVIQKITKFFSKLLVK